MTAELHLFNIIVIVIIFNTLHNNFKITMVSMLEIGNKITKKIQSIIQLKEAKYKAK